MREHWRRRYPALDRFTRNIAAVASLLVIVALFVVATVGPLVYTVDPAAIDYSLVGEPLAPSAKYPAGTDNQGRDQMARLLAGARISLAVGVIAMFINLVLGVAVGVVAGWCYSSEKAFWRFVDTILTRMVDILYSIPVILIVVLLQVFVKRWMDAQLASWGYDRNNMPLLLTPDLLCIYIALGFTNWLTMARLARGEVINHAKSDYVLAARAIGQKGHWILLRHILPNCIGPVAVASTLAVPQAIFTESFLAFIGIGVSAPQASWGTMASDALPYMGVAPHMLIYPAIAISVTMLAFNLFGDGLRDALDPSSR
jgi:oligopeptide transport system permease protein